jgi:hypothetical protein
MALQKKYELRLAYIDHMEASGLFAMILRDRDIDVKAAGSLEEFEEKYNLEEFPVLLFHPGVKKQHEFLEVREKYPNLVIAGITSPGSDQDYNIFKKSREQRKGFDLRIFTYFGVEDIEEFLKQVVEKQDGR